MLLSPLWQEGADVTMASVPKVLDGQSDSPTGEEMTQPVTVADMEKYMFDNDDHEGKYPVMKLNLYS